MGDIRDCPSLCGAKIQICRTLVNRPEIVSVGVVWDSERPTLEHIMSVFALVGTSLKLQDVFQKVVDARWAQVKNKKKRKEKKRNKFNHEIKSSSKQIRINAYHIR